MDSDPEQLINTLPRLMSSHSQGIQGSGTCHCQHQCLSQPDAVQIGTFFKQFPSTWDAPGPDSRISRCTFKIFCFIFTLHGDLHWLHNFLKEGNTWEEVHGQYLTHLNHLSTVVSRRTIRADANNVSLGSKDSYSPQQRFSSPQIHHM